MIVGAVVLPQPPLLLPGLTGGELVPEVEQLRSACVQAVRELVSRVPDRLVVVGGQRPDENGDEQETAGRVAPWPERGAGEGLPLSLTVGMALLEQAGVATRGAELCAVPTELPTARCLDLGTGLVDGPERTALVVLGDGSARRRTTSPGYIDERAIGYDKSVERALVAGDLQALASLDPGLAGELLVAGRAAWQVMAGALAARPNGAVGTGDRTDLVGRLHYSDDPFGVWYAVATLLPTTNAA